MDNTYSGGMTSHEKGQYGTTQYGRSKNEGELTSKIEKQTARVPSLTFLALAGAAVMGSVVLLLSGRRAGSSDWGHFLGTLVPTFLILGLYNKVVKEHEGLTFMDSTTRH